MYRNRRMLALAFVFSFVCRSYCEDAKSDKIFMWKVTSDSTTIYLLGSVHMATPDMYPLPAEMEKAYGASKFVVLEADASPAGQMKIQMALMKKGPYGPGESLSTSVSKETVELINDYAKDNALVGLMKAQMKPWVLMALVQQAELQKLGFDPKLGIDMHFSDKARADKKELLELESAEFQVDLFSSLPKDQIEKALVSSIKDAGETKDSIGQAIKDWKNGDADGMNEHMILKGLKKEPDSKPTVEKLLFERNVTMAEKIDGYLKTKDVYLVIAGAAHMVGDKGLVKLLKDKKYKVEQVKRAPAAK